VLYYIVPIMLLVKRASCTAFQRSKPLSRSRLVVKNLVKTGGNDEEEHRKYQQNYATRMLVDNLNALLQVPAYQDIEPRDLVEVIWNKWHKNYKVHIESNVKTDDVVVKISWQIVDQNINMNNEYLDVVTRLNKMKLGSELLRKIIDHETQKRFDFLMQDIYITLNVGEKGERLIEWE